MTNPAALEATVTRQHASRVLNIGQRRIRELCSLGRLVTVGSGSGRRITVTSLATEVERRRKVAFGTGIDGNRGHLLPDFCSASLSTDAIPRDDGLVTIRFPRVDDSLHGLTLLPIPQAAAILGLNEDLMRELVNTGVVPSVRVGARRRVTLDDLREWVRGESGSKGVRS